MCGSSHLPRQRHRQDGACRAKQDGFADRYLAQFPGMNVTTLAAAAASVQGIAAVRKGRGLVKSLQEYHADLPR